MFTRAHATAPLCSPSRGSLFTGRYPHSNGLVGLAHHGFEYRAGVRTLPQILHETGLVSALFGMQHETSFPARLGFDEFDVSNSYCDYVVDRAQEWLTESAPDRPRQPVPAHGRLLRNPPALSPRPVRTRRHRRRRRPRLPARHPASPRRPRRVLRLDRRRRRRGRPTARHPRRDRASTTAPGWCSSPITAPRSPAPSRRSTTPAPASRRSSAHRGGWLSRRRSTTNCSAASICCRRSSNWSASPPATTSKGCRTPRNLLAQRLDPTEVRDHVYTEKTYHDSYDPIRAIRTKDYSYIENYAQRPLLDLPLDIEESPSGQAVEPFINAPRPPRELYDLRADPTEVGQSAGGRATDDGRGDRR